MPSGSNRVTERQVGEAVLKTLAEADTGEILIHALKWRLPQYLRLSDADRLASPTRRNEPRWGQQVRDLINHRDVAGNVICDGYADYRPRHLKITEAGRRRVARDA